MSRRTGGSQTHVVFFPSSLLYGMPAPRGMAKQHLRTFERVPVNKEGRARLLCGGGGEQLYAGGARLYAGGAWLYARGGRLYAGGVRLYAEGVQLYAGECGYMPGSGHY